MSTTPSTPTSFGPSIVTIEMGDGTAATTKLRWLGMPMRTDVTIQRIFHHTSDKPKTASMSVLINVPVSKLPSGETLYAQEAVELLGARTDRYWVNYLFGDGAFELAYPNGLKWNTDDQTVTNVTDPPPEDDYTSPTDQKDISMTPYDFTVSNVSTLFSDTFVTLEPVWTLVDNMAHSATNESLVSTGTGEATANVGIDSTTQREVQMFFNFVDVPTNSVFLFSNGNYAVQYTKEVKVDGTYTGRIRLMNPQTGEYVDSDLIGLGNQFVFTKDNEHLIIDVIDTAQATPQSTRLAYMGVFDDTARMDWITWRAQDNLGTRQELESIRVDKVTITS